MNRRIPLRLRYIALIVLLICSAVFPAAPASAADNPPWVSDINVSPVDYDGVTVSGTVTLSVTAGDDVGISKVEFYSANGGYLIATKTAAPYSVNWATDPWVPDGDQILKVIAYDTAGQTAGASRTVYVQNDKTAPSTPGSVAVTGKTDRTVSLSWTPATDNIGVVEYEIYNGLVRIGTSTTNSVTLDKLKPSTTYNNLNVKARDRAWNFSGASNSVSVTTLADTDRTAPSAPTQLTTLWVNDTRARLEWMTATDDNAVTGYNIYNGTTLLTSTSGNRVTVSNLSPSTAYTVTVKAKDNAGNLSPASNTISFTTGVLDTSAPTAPWDLTAPETSKSTVTLRWKVPSDNYGVTSYEIYQNWTKIGETTSTNYVVKGLSASTSYMFYVTAKDYAGNVSPASNHVTAVTATTGFTAPSRAIRAYYAAWSTYSGYDVMDIDGSKISHINYAFADIGDDLKIKVGDATSDINKTFPGDTGTEPFKGNFNQLKKFKQTYPHVKTTISVGGWGWSQKFSDVALTDASRTAFADSVVTFLTTYGFDGVDFDWEYPVSGGMPENVRRPVDGKNFTLLVQKVRQKLDAQGAVDGKRYEISIAGGANNTYADNVQLGQMAQYLDYIQTMTYDFGGPWDKVTGFNAPLYPMSSSDPNAKTWSVSQAVEYYMSKGVPASKLVMGVPFYGYEFKQVTNANNGLGQSYSGPTASKTYGDLEKDYFGKNGFTSYWQSDSQVPWLFNGSTFVSYENTTSMSAKASYIKSKGLAGAMIWEVSQDPGEVLLQQLNSDLK